MSPLGDPERARVGRLSRSANDVRHEAIAAELERERVLALARGPALATAAMRRGEQTPPARRETDAHFFGGPELRRNVRVRGDEEA